MRERAAYASEWRRTSPARSASREYSSWIQMIARCTKPKHRNWPEYGGRGITVCDRWLTFEHFRADMGDRPPNTSLDRIDNAKGYSPANCRWATHAEQQRNRSISKLKPEQVVELKQRYEAGGVTQTALARDYGISIAMANYIVRGKYWVTP